MEKTQTRARAQIRGRGPWSAVNGLATFRQCNRGVLVTVEVEGLPQGEEARWFQVDISRGQNCIQAPGPLPSETQIPHRSRDGEGYEGRCNLLILMDCGGVAFSSCLTDQFRVEQILGRRLVILICRQKDTHAEAPGEGVLACGEIVAGC